MTTLIVATAEGVSLRHEIAGAGSRCVAALLDCTLIMSGYLVVVLGIAIAARIDGGAVSSFFYGVIAGGGLLVFLGYHVLFHLLRRGQTPGKQMLGVRVMSADGYPPSALQIVLRALIAPLDLLLFVPLPIGLIAIAATNKHQRLGDLVANTLVVRLPRLDERVEPWPNERWSALAAKHVAIQPGMQARLAPADLEFLRELLTRRELHAEQQRELFVSAARAYSERLGLGPFEDARVVLKELYLFLRETGAQTRSAR